MSGSGLDPEARRRVSLAVRAGEAVRDPADAPAAVELARLAQRRLQDRTLPAALRISAGVVAVWLVLVALPVKTWALLTMNTHGWLTRKSDRLGGEGQDHASLAS